MKTLSIVCPVYFNAGSLPELFDRLLAVEAELQQREIGLQIVFIDDGSGDNSLDLLRGFKERRPETTVVKLTRNFGCIHATRAGVDFATGDCLVFLAADLQDPPELIPEMADHWLEGAKYVICAREGRDDPLGSRLSSRLYYWIIRSLVVPDYPDQGFDMALMDDEIVKHLRACGKHTNISLFTFWLGYTPVILHHKRGARVHGESKWSFTKKLKLFADSVFGFSFAPIRLMSAVGALVSLLSVGYGVAVVIGTLLGYGSAPGFATLVALVTFLLGMVIVMLGVIGEYIWRVFDIVNNHPESVVDEVL